MAGETITARATVDVRGSSPVRVVLAALGSQMLVLAGARADGTVTWMTGPATLSSHTVPTIVAAAAALPIILSVTPVNVPRLDEATVDLRALGLGLAIVRRIIAEHGGSIEVADNVPHGTVFTIELPL